MDSPSCRPIRLSLLDLLLEEGEEGGLLARILTIFFDPELVTKVVVAVAVGRAGEGGEGIGEMGGRDVVGGTPLFLLATPRFLLPPPSRMVVVVVEDEELK